MQVAIIFKTGNKIEKANPKLVDVLSGHDFSCISAEQNKHQRKILSAFQVKTIKSGDVAVTNLRHYHHLVQTHEALDRVLSGWRIM